MARIDEDDRVILRERERYLEAPGRSPDPSRVRPEIAASWRRSLASLGTTANVDPDFRRPRETQLSAAALPVIDHYLDSLADTHTSLLLSDGDGRLVGRWTHDVPLRAKLSTANVEAGFSMAEGVVGTNGVGTVFEAGTAVEIKGAEHFSERYLPFTCVGAPIRHPLTRRIVGVVDITSRLEDSSSLAMPWILHMASQIEGRLLDQATVRERTLLGAYLLTVRRSSHAVLCLDGEMVICNPLASALLTDADQRYIWEHLKRNGFRAPAQFTALELPTGRVLKYRPRVVQHDGLLLGVVVEALEEAPSRSSSGTMALPAAAPRLDGLAGSGDRWNNLSAQALAWREDGAGIAVTGEPGVGKMSVLRAVFGDDPGFDVFDCALVVVDGPRDWLSALRTRLQEPDGVVVLRHVEMLDDAVAQALCTILDGCENPPRLAATVIEGGQAQAFTPLLDRIATHRLEMPPLRHRLDDLPALLASPRIRGERGPRWSPDAIEVLSQQSWPDNIRGLAALARRVTLNRPTGVVTIADLPDELSAARALPRTLTQLERLERQEIIEALTSSNGNKVIAAKKLNLARSTLYRKMTTLSITPVAPGR